MKQHSSMPFGQQALFDVLSRCMWQLSRNVAAESLDWYEVDKIACSHAVVSLAYGGTTQIKDQVPADILMKWKHTTIAGAIRNEHLMVAQTEALGWFKDAGIPAAILKGSSVARYYPQPELRLLGDIDVLVRREDIPVAKEILASHGYVEHESDHAFHISYNKDDVYLELHYDLSEMPDSEGGDIVREGTKGRLDEIQTVSIGDYEFTVLSEPYQALSLLLHMERHMVTTGIGLRQLCDWAVYIANTDGDILNKSTLPLLKECGLFQYAKVVTKACALYLGVDAKKVPWCEDAKDRLCDAFMDDVFRSGNLGKADTEGMGSLFTDRMVLGRGGQNSCKALISTLNRLSYQHFSFTKKWKILLPVFWLYLPVRYLVRAKIGLRPQKSVVKVLSTSRQRQKLYKQLRLFEIK